jgi:hypothetical protein
MYLIDVNIVLFCEGRKKKTCFYDVLANNVLPPASLQPPPNRPLTFHGQLRGRLRDLTKEFGDLRQRMHSDYREAVERRVAAVTGERPPEVRGARGIPSGVARSAEVRGRSPGPRSSPLFHFFLSFLILIFSIFYI